MTLKKTIGYRAILNWLATRDRKPFLFQEQTWEQITNGNSGLVNAPTGYGKTYSVFLGPSYNSSMSTRIITSLKKTTGSG
ncbi:MAG: hypothetical protein QM737_16630 [Ferruginibacter sp.]